MNQAITSFKQPGAMVSSLLGASSCRIPTAGKIRAGIKVLTRKAAEHAKARDLYDQGIAAGHGFERIEESIVAAVPELKSPLVPKNAPYFTVRRGDFPNPVIADEILAAHGEDRGDGERRLYRFPVIFPADSWQAVMPHELVCWGSNERKFWSEYSADGQTRHCKCYAPVPLLGTKRAVRPFGGRKIILRAENGGLCNPEACPQYQERQCNLEGRFVFFIPGIKSLSAFELTTHSFYSMNAAIQKFQMVGFMRGGRISGFLDADRTPFYLSKRLTEVAHIDGEGRPVRVKQWLIELEAPVDLTALLRADEGHEAAEVRASRAVHILEGTTTSSHADRADEGDVFGAPTRAATDSEVPARSVSARRESAADAVVRTESPTPAAGTGRPAPARPTTASPPVGDLATVLAAAQSLGVPAERFERYADQRWGQGWKLNPGGRKRARDEVRNHEQDPGRFRSMVDAELNRQP